MYMYMYDKNDQNVNGPLLQLSDIRVDVSPELGRVDSE